MNIVFWGTPLFAVNILDKLLNSKHNIVAVVTQPDKRRGRGKELTGSPVKKIANDLNIPVFTPVSINKEIDIQSKIRSLSADIYVVVAFGQILPESVINTPLYGSWNIHASLLPTWRGASPIQRSILNGDKETGVGIMAMEKGLDTGPVLIEKSLQIGITDNKELIENKLAMISCELIIDALDIIEQSSITNKQRLNKNLSLKRQEDSVREISYAKQITKTEYEFTWELETIKIHRIINGLYPNAFIKIRGKRVKCLESIPLNPEYKNELEEIYHNYIFDSRYKKYKVGQVIDIIKGKGFIIKTNDCALFIKEAQVEGKKRSNGYIVSKQLCINIGDLI